MASSARSLGLPEREQQSPSQDSRPRRAAPGAKLSINGAAHAAQSGRSDPKHVDGRNSKRPIAAIRREARARMPDKAPGFLRRATLRSSVTKQRYVEAAEVFARFCRGQGLRTQSIGDVDKAMESYFEKLYNDGEPSYAARATLYGWIYSRMPQAVGRTKAEKFPLARASLAGWENLEPTQTQDPAPWEAVLLIASWLLQRSLWAAVVTVLLFDTYCRPGEMLGLVREHLLRPVRRVGAHYNKWGLVICPQEELKGTKTNKRDDSVIIGINDRAWVAELCPEIWRLAKKGESLFDMSLATLERLFREACSALELKKLRITPHSLRHGGPSTDRYRGHLNLLEIKRRGRWASEASVVRYERHAKLLRQLGKLSPKQQAAARKAAREVPRKLVEALRAVRSR